MLFAEKLRRLREAAGLTQSGLAERAGLPIGSIRNYEQGQREPLWRVLFKITQALGTTCEEFADCDDIYNGMGKPQLRMGRPPKSGGAAPAKRRKRKE
jgi:transcriptional regulator with XRE-family HTH domain